MSHKSSMTHQAIIATSYLIGRVIGLLDVVDLFDVVIRVLRQLVGVVLSVVPVRFG